MSRIIGNILISDNGDVVMIEKMYQLSYSTLHCKHINEEYVKLIRLPPIRQVTAYGCSLMLTASGTLLDRLEELSFDFRICQINRLFTSKIFSLLDVDNNLHFYHIDNGLLDDNLLEGMNKNIKGISVSNESTSQINSINILTQDNSILEINCNGDAIGVFKCTQLDEEAKNLYGSVIIYEDKIQIYGYRGKIFIDIDYQVVDALCSTGSYPATRVYTIDDQGVLRYYIIESDWSHKIKKIKGISEPIIQETPFPISRFVIINDYKLCTINKLIEDIDGNLYELQDLRKWDCPVRLLNPSMINRGRMIKSAKPK